MLGAEREQTDEIIRTPAILGPERLSLCIRRGFFRGRANGKPYRRAGVVAGRSAISTGVSRA